MVVIGCLFWCRVARARRTVPVAFAARMSRRPCQFYSLAFDFPPSLQTLQATLHRQSTLARLNIVDRKRINRTRTSPQHKGRALTLLRSRIDHLCRVKHKNVQHARAHRTRDVTFVLHLHERREQQHSRILASRGKVRNHYNASQAETVEVWFTSQQTDLDFMSC